MFGRGLLVATRIVMHDGGVCTCFVSSSILKTESQNLSGSVENKTKQNLTAFYSELSPSGSKGQFVHENKD